MRCRLRYRTGWTAFLFIFTLIGVILTYRQLGEHEKETLKSSKFYDPQNEMLKHFNQKQFGVEAPVLQNEFDHKPVAMGQDNVRIHMPKRKLPREPVDIMKVTIKPDVDNFSQAMVTEIILLLRDLYPSNWGKAANADEMALRVKETLMDMGIFSKMSCKDIDYLRVAASVRIGRKKYIDRAYVDNHGAEVIVKSQAVDQEIKIKCMQHKYDYEKCQVMGNYILLREIILMSVLKHPSIIGLRGYCIRGDNINYNIKKKGIILATQPGSVVNAVTLSLYSWKAKLLYAIQLADLLKYLKNSPIGSVALLNLRPEDFVLVDEWIKLVDLDDVLFEEKKCKANVDCVIHGAAKYEAQCSNERCTDRNAAYNIYQLNMMFEQLLKNPPPDQKSKVMSLRQSMSVLDITAESLLKQLNELKTAAIESGSAHYVQPVNNQGVQVHRYKNVEREKEMQQNRIQPLHDRKSHDYVRVAESNFPGMHDYTCRVSRVAWGCVFTVRSLLQAKATCDADPICKAFVLFTSNPDTAMLMTMVAKNSGSSKPERNAGATLFIKSSEMLAVGAPVVKATEKDNIANKAVVSRESPLECFNRQRQSTAEARVSREKRLMAHLGLKGFTDVEWQSKMKTQKITEAKKVINSMLAVGGRYQAELRGHQADKQFQKAIFLSELGPMQHHVAHMIAYKLDRTLGLYHTPPSLVWPMSVTKLNQVKGDNYWNKFVELQTLDDDSVKGVLTVSVPRVVKEEPLYLTRLASMTGDITPFSRMEKMQLEYIFLWYLTKTLHSKNEHLGYKGHLIHFDGDRAFQDVSVDLIGYFFHCQFPSVVYKALSCFKCQGKSSHSGSGICSLGQEVLQQVVESGFERSTFDINRMKEEEIATVINNAASSVFRQVDICIKAFGREEVLY